MAPAKHWQQVEGAAVFLAALVGLWVVGLPFAVWVAFAIFWAPDLVFGLYLLGPRIGGAAYNCVHIYGFGAAVLAAGLLGGWPWLAAAGALWMGHAGFDRMLGYGLKLPTGFQDTHLGRIGRR